MFPVVSVDELVREPQPARTTTAATEASVRILIRSQYARFAMVVTHSWLISPLARAQLPLQRSAVRW
jgi:hypothetical protein